MENLDFVFILTISILGAVLLFTIGREFVAWYYKVNQRIDLLERNNLLLEKLLASKGISLANYGEKPIKIKIKPTEEVLIIGNKQLEILKKQIGEKEIEVLEQ